MLDYHSSNSGVDPLSKKTAQTVVFSTLFRR